MKYILAGNIELEVDITVRDDPRDREIGYDPEFEVEWVGLEDGTEIEIDDLYIKYGGEIISLEEHIIMEYLSDSG